MRSADAVRRHPAVTSRDLTVDGRALRVIGVLPAGFQGLIGRTDLWAPLGSARWLGGDTGPERPSSRHLQSSSIIGGV